MRIPVVAHELFSLAWPSVMSSIITQASGLITIFFVASFDDQYLLGSVGLGSMAQNVFGFSLGRGLNSALDTLVSQSNGAGNYMDCGAHLRRAQIVSLLVSVPCISALIFAEDFFLFVGINARSAHDAGNYVLGTLPSMPLCFLYNATRSFLRAVKKPRPDFYVNVIVVLFHPLWCIAFLHWADWGAFGAGVTVSCSNSLQFSLLTTYVAIMRPGPSRIAWRCLPWPFASSFSSESNVSENGGSFRGYFAVALPSAILVWSEWWVYEIMSLLAGLCGTEALAAHTAVCSLLIILYMIPSGLGNATSALVGNAIGEGNVEMASSAVALACIVMVVLFLVIGALVLVLRSQLARIFNSQSDVVGTFSNLCLILAPFLVLDALQTVLEGALRGLGMQSSASRAKLTSMLCVRLLGAYALAILLHVGVAGIWWAGLWGMLVTVVLYFRILCFVDLKHVSEEVRRNFCSDIRDVGPNDTSIPSIDSEN